MIRRLAVLACVAAAAAVATPAPASPPGAPAIRGIAVGLYDHRDPDRGQWKRRLVEIRKSGATHVSVVVHWRQRDVRSTTLAPHPDITVPDARLRQVLREARRQKLEVFLFPIVDVEIRRPMEWRGTIAPTDVDAWWKAYEAFILHYARIAAEEKADLYSVGSELGSTEAWRDRWYHLISRVQKLYKGPLVYSANWDHYTHVSFWERVDYLGVTGYHELTRSNDASVDELTRAWAKVRAQLVAFAQKQGKPLMITEVGYTSQDGAAVHPWDYTSRARVDLEEQRRCYEAFVAAWKGEPALAGVFWWIWYGEGGERDPGYTPRGKPAEKVLRAWFGAAD